MKAGLLAVTVEARRMLTSNMYFTMIRILYPNEVSFKMRLKQRH